MSSSKTIIALAAILIIGALVGYLAWFNYQNEIRDYRPFQKHSTIQAQNNPLGSRSTQTFIPQSLKGELRRLNEP
jgi:hypothetical protein